MKEHVFEEDNFVGSRGEQIFEAYCAANGISAMDVTENPEWQKVDVDFVVYGEDGLEYTYEIKNDTKIGQTGNVFYEDVSNVDYGTVGCFEKTVADYVVVCSEPERKMYVIDAKRLRGFVHAVGTSLKRISRVEGSNSSGLLVPLRRISKIVSELRY